MSKSIKPVSHEEWIREMFPHSDYQRPPNSFTIKEVVKATGLNERTARSRINVKIDSGELSFTTGIWNGRRTNFYFETKKK